MPCSDPVDLILNPELLWVVQKSDICANFLDADPDRAYLTSMLDDCALCA